MLLQRTNRFPAREASPTFKLQVRPPGPIIRRQWIPPSPVYAGISPVRTGSRAVLRPPRRLRVGLDIRVRLGVTVTASGTQAGKP